MKRISVSTAVAVLLGLLLLMVLVSVNQPYYHVAKVPQELYQETVPEPDEVLYYNDRINKQGDTTELRIIETKGSSQPAASRKDMGGLKVPQEHYQEQQTVPELDGALYYNDRINKQEDTNELRISETKESSQPAVSRTDIDGLKVFRNLSRGLLIQEKYGKYKQGKRIIYETLYRCRSPQFLDDHKSPCWKSERRTAKDQTYCGPRVTLLGFHKSGTTDLSKWFEVAAFSAINTGFFLNELGKMCPHEFLENRKRMFVKSPDITTYGDCPGCLINTQVLRVGPNDVVLHSVAQYIQYLRKENSKYIITMRNPTDRTLSHYFYSFKAKLRPDHPIYKAGKKPEDIGYDVLHEVVMKAVQSLKECLVRYGVTECIVVTSLRNDHVEDDFMAGIVAFSCYSAFIREVLKFLPRDDIYLSKMEDYAVHPEIVVPELFKFLGEDADRINMGLANHIKNTGVTVKPVHQKTIDLLDEFFEPFNEELAEMMGDEKWLFKREPAQETS